MSWFETVTGTSNAERQAWRDNFNGGYAVGAGASFYNSHLPGAGGGGSLGGSKTEVGGAVKGTGTPGPAPTTTVKHVEPTNTGRGGGPVLVKDDWSPTRYAPNQPGGPVTTGNPGPGQQVGTGPGTGGGGFLGLPDLSNGYGPMKIKVKDQATGGLVGGIYWEPSPWQSDVEEFWEPRYGEPGEWLGGIANIAVDLHHNAGRLNDWISDTWNKETKVKPADFSNMTPPDWDFDSDLRWAIESSAGNVGGGF